MGNTNEDLTGQIFGRLTVIKQSGKMCECQCECGNTRTVTARALKIGNTKSCGCLRAENAKIAAKKIKTTASPCPPCSWRKMDCFAIGAEGECRVLTDTLFRNRAICPFFKPKPQPTEEKDEDELDG